MTVQEELEHFEIVLSIKKNDEERTVAFASYGDFATAYRAFYPIIAGEETLPLTPDICLLTGIVEASLVLSSVEASCYGSEPLVVYVKTLPATEVMNKIRWLETTHSELPSELVFLPDYGSVCAQHENGEMSSALDLFSEYVPWDIELCVLANEIDDWRRLYERGVHIDPKMNYDFDWEGFHAKAMVLFKKLQQMLGHRSQVVYVKITELEPPDDECCRVTFSPD